MSIGSLVSRYGIFELDQLNKLPSIRGANRAQRNGMQRLVEQLRRLASPLAILTLLLVAMWLLHRELSQYRIQDVMETLRDLPAWKLFLAISLTVISFASLTLYDFLSASYIKSHLSRGKIAVASFLGFAISNSFGVLLGGTAVRMRLFSVWGVSSVDILKYLLMLSTTFWVGTFALSAIIFGIDPLPIPEKLHMPVVTAWPLSIFFTALTLGYIGVCGFTKGPLRIRGWELTLPSWKFGVMQCIVGAIDLLLASAVLYVLMPESVPLSYAHFLAIYLLAIIVSVISHVPGGVGIMELVVIVLLDPKEPHAVLGAMLVYRVIYYLLPLVIGMVILGGNELIPHRSRMVKVAKGMGKWSALVAPRFFSVTVFLSGMILLFSGATPADETRLRWIRSLLPLPVIEVSHMLGSIAGLLLLMLARSLQRRIETAYYAVVALLVSGIGLSLLKGGAIEEAIVLIIMLALFIPSRKHFYRKGAVFVERLTLQWFFGIALVLVTTIWLMLFAYKHVEYEHQLWWRFAFEGSAPRSLRALACVLLVLLVIGFARLLRARAVPPQAPSEEDLAAVRDIVAKSAHTSSHLALVGDKFFLFNESRTAFLMYGVEGKSWVVLGDPVGNAASRRELAWAFRDLCDEGGCWPVFYQIDAENLPIYVEMGLSLIKIGEEARVSISEFSLEGSSRKGMRRTIKQVGDAGGVFEILPAPQSNATLDEIKVVSDGWLSSKNTAEKGFSLGFFQREYLRESPLAIVRKDGKIVAFANLLLGGEKEELSLDLMRSLPDAPNSCMEYLFIQIILWGKAEGFKWFNLGMAPLSGVEQRPLGPLWNRIAGIVYEHGEQLYNFQGLRQYKDKFDPVWEPKYLVSPGGWVLPIILANVASLISGGLTKLWRK